MTKIPVEINHHTQVKTLLNTFFAKKPLCGIEIGTNSGVLTKSILERCVIKFLWTIDPYHHVPGAGFEAGNPMEYHNAQKKEALRHIGNHPGKCELLEMTSDQAHERLSSLAHFEKSPFDFVWIDGHHTEEQVRRDINNYIDLVREGGILGGHDYRLVPDVTKVIHETFKPAQINLGGDYTWWIYV